VILPDRLLPLTSEIDAGGRLSIGGLDVCELATEYGTPLFVYDEAHLRARCREAVQAWGDGVAYATKAFLCKAMAALAHEEGMMLDVSTGGELYVALEAQVPGHRLILHGNNKSDAELQAAVDAHVHRIVVDSFDELDRISKLDARPNIMLRVTPGVEAHTHEYVRTGQDDSKFGFGLASGAADQALKSANNVKGIHAHIGSQVFNVESFEAEIEALGAWFNSTGLDELCVGGGLGVAYVEGERAPTITEWAATVHRACENAGITAKITAEPGRSIVAAAAITVYTAGTIKELKGLRTYLSVDGGMSDNPRPVLYGSGYEAFLPRATNAPRPRRVRVVGKHCESGDVIVADASVPEDVMVGDFLATPVTGAYGYSMASNYNKVPRPAVLFVSAGHARQVVRRETYEDLVRLDA
jgi:diaminopimelate decarboxylase